MAERARQLAAILPILLAVLSAGVVPHLHAAEGCHVGAGSGPAIEASPHAELPAVRSVDAGDCVTCRSGQSSRLAIAGSLRVAPVAPGGAGLPFFEGVPPTAAARLVREASPPRAPPV